MPSKYELNNKTEKQSSYKCTTKKMRRLGGRPVFMIPSQEAT